MINLTKVYLVGISDCESMSIFHICKTKELADKRLEEVKDNLIKDWKKLDTSLQKSLEEYCKKENKPIYIDNMYKEMIDHLEKNESNYPHETPFIEERELEE